MNAEIPTNSLAARLRLAMGDHSVNHFAHLCEMPESTVRKYVNGIAMPGSERLKRMATVAGVNVEWLLSGEGEMQAAQLPRARRRKSEAQIEHDLVRLPVLDITAGAGTAYDLVEQEPVEDFIAFSRPWIRRYCHTSPDGLSLIYVRGESMEPTLRSGELILVDTKSTQPREGIHVLRLDDALLVKRLHPLPGRRLKVVSDNPIYEPFEVDLAQENIAIVGRVLASLRWYG